jgi:hypothetical protein
MSTLTLFSDTENTYIKPTLIQLWPQGKKVKTNRILAVSKIRMAQYFTILFKMLLLELRYGDEAHR